MNATGHIAKMQVSASVSNDVQYKLPIADKLIDLNDLLDSQVNLEFTGKINCIYCNKSIKKTYQNGYCFPCTMRLARCDLCIVKPERCHYHLGTCREPNWGDTHCMIEHYVYLANSSGLKVGLTKTINIPDRWMDQGAIQAVPIFKVKTRRIAGLIEVMLAENISDKTNWRKMLTNQIPKVDLAKQAKILQTNYQAKFSDLIESFGEDAVQSIDELNIYDFNYPVIDYPIKINSLSLDKTSKVSGILKGIKGQYLILDTGVINIRKFSGYEISFKS